MRHQWWVQLHPKCKTLGAKGDPADGRICYIRADEWKSIKLKALPLLAAVNTSKRDILVRRRILLECALLVTHTAVPVLIAARFIRLRAMTRPLSQVTFSYPNVRTGAADGLWCRS